MKLKAVISVALATLLCVMMLPMSALAGMTGDVDANGKVDSTDARLALRAAVGLDTLTEDAKKAADVDFNNTVDATDARFILRAAVGLEKLPEAQEPETPDEPEVPDEPETPDEPEAPETHTKHEFTAISLTGETKCTHPGCDAVLPAFNDIVNELKAPNGKADCYTGIFEDISHFDEPQLSGILAEMMEDEELSESTEITYAPLKVDYPVGAQFHSKNASYVSDLADSDVKSISLERAETVDFVSALPDKFTSGKNEYNLGAIKAYEFPELYKVTIVLPDQSIDITQPVSGASPYDKIYTKDYNKTLESMRKEVSSGFDSLSQEMAGLEGMIKMKNSGTVKASLTVEYYLTTDTFTPVAARYSHVIDVNFNIKLTDTLGVTKYLTMDQKMDMTSNSYYFFNNNFSVK